MRAIETLVQSVLLRAHYTAEGGGGGDLGARKRRVCTRAAFNGRWCWARVCGAAADGKGGTSGKGRRGENPRNREDHPVTPVTDEGGPPRARAATRTLTCWCVAEPVPTWWLSRDVEKRFRKNRERTGTNATRTHHARERDSRYHPAMRAARVPVADNGEKLARTDRE